MSVDDLAISVVEFGPLPHGDTLVQQTLDRL